MARYLVLAVMVAATALPGPAAAKPKASAKAAPKKPAAVPAAVKPIEIPPPATPRLYMVPNEVVLRKTTPAEAEANAVWNLRAALNVAALQCQFSPFLHTVDNYNQTLRHHGDEFARAQATMVGHFKRYDGARALNSFDQYTTRTYNSYSTLDAQYTFCSRAGLIGRIVLTIPQGKLGPVALARYSEMRAALIPAPISAQLARVDLTPIEIPDIEEAR